MGSLLQQEATSGNITLSLYEFDIERSPEHDLTRDQLWDKINSLLKEGYILIVSPPCNTFSRARFQWLRHPGPRPLRNVNWPKGFPWLSSKNKAVVEEANSFIFRCIDSCLLCHRCGGKFFWEHPEDLGEVHSEHPASIWQWAEIRDLLVQTNAKHLQFNNVILGPTHLSPQGFCRQCLLMTLGVILVGLSFLRMYIVGRCHGHVAMFISRNSLDGKMENGKLAQVRPTQQAFVNLSLSCVSLPHLWSEGAKTTHLLPLHLQEWHLHLHPWSGRVTHPALHLRLVRSLIHTLSLVQQVLQ